MINPFIVHAGRVYIIEGWDERMKGNRTLVIRPLSVREMAIWRSNFEESGFETYAQIIVRQDRNSAASKDTLGERKNRKGK